MNKIIRFDEFLNCGKIRLTPLQVEKLHEMLFLNKRNTSLRIDAFCSELDISEDKAIKLLKLLHEYLVITIDDYSCIYCNHDMSYNDWITTEFECQNCFRENTINWDNIYTKTIFGILTEAELINGETRIIELLAEAKRNNLVVQITGVKDGRVYITLKGVGVNAGIELGELSDNIIKTLENMLKTASVMVVKNKETEDYKNRLIFELGRIFESNDYNELVELADYLKVERYEENFRKQKKYLNKLLENDFIREVNTDETKEVFNDDFDDGIVYYYINRVEF